MRARGAAGAIMLPLWTLLLSLPVVHAQEAGQPITAVVFAGDAQLSEAFLRGIVRTRPGEAYDPARLDEDVARLLRSERVLTATYEVSAVEGGVSVRFIVSARPTVGSLRFAGAERLSDRKLKKAIALKEGDRVDPFALRQARDAVIALYRDEGYGDVQVSVDDDLALRTGEVVFTVTEGRRTRVRKIAFEGNATYPPRELKRQTEIRTVLWPFRKGVFDVDAVERDVANLQRYYRNEGFLDATVGYRTEVLEEEDLRLVFDIEEGTRYTIEEIRIVGNTVYRVDELMRLVGSSVGGPIRQAQVDADVRALTGHYGEYGYIYATVRADRVFSETPGQVILTFEIVEDEQFRVGKVIVRGNTRTRDKVVRRALNLYPPNDLFNMTEAQEAEQRLRDTGIFSSARVFAAGNQPGVRDAIIAVEESEKIGDFIFAVGVTSNSGVVGSIVLDFKNFDLMRPPRDLREFFSLRAFQGGGQRLRLELQPGTEVTRYRIDFVEPYFLERPLRLGVSTYLFQRGRESYDEQRFGATVSLGRRIERGWLQDWSTDWTLRGENVKIDDLELFAARDIQDVEGSSPLTSVRYSLTRDRTDNRFLPTQGDRLRLSLETVSVDQFDYFFGKTLARYSWYKTMYTDIFERKGVLEITGEAGYIIGDAPVFERFYAGGMGSVRGFAFRTISPRDGLEDDEIGGDFLLTLSTEYSFPVYGDNVRGLFFVDMGTVEDEITIDSWRASIGVGVRMVIDLLGPIPIEVDLGVPFLKEDEDDEQFFGFSIGTAF